MKPLLTGLLLVSALSAAPDKQSFTGLITDNMCSTGDHSRMRMGSTDAECADACVMTHGAGYVLYDGKTVYYLSDQLTAGKFSARRVKVVGTLDAKTKTIRVESISAAS